MRSLIVLALLVAVASCSGGGGIAVADFDPTGRWTVQDGESYNIRATGAGKWIVDPVASDLPNSYMTVDGNSFTWTGEEWDLSHRWHSEFISTGAFNGNTMTGSGESTLTDTQTGEIEVTTGSFTATRTP